MSRKKKKKNKEKWKEHLDRIPDERFLRYILKYRPQGRRGIVKPCRRWNKAGNRLVSLSLKGRRRNA
jgi:hypothetical protein